MSSHHKKTHFRMFLILGALITTSGYAVRDTLPRSAAHRSLTPAEPMHTARAVHTATSLNDGTVLIAGGFARDRESNPFASAERFDPKAGVFASTGDMTTGRQSHSATLLPDGRVLITGGYAGAYLASAEIYDPASGTFTATSEMTTRRIAHRATLLSNGSVLITGGKASRSETLASAEIYDPIEGTFTSAKPMTTPRISHTQTLLPDGSVLIVGGTVGARSAGGVSASAELYDPISGSFNQAADMHTPRHKHAAVLMEDERVLVIGGSDERDGRGRYDTAEIFDPSTGTFLETGRLNSARFKLRGAVTLLADGDVLVAGGAAVVELFNPETERFTALPEQLDASRFFSTVTVMPDGRALITGGYDFQIESSAKAWVYAP